MNVAVTIFAIGMSLMAPILWAALGELIIEQSGVLNIGIEGVMLIGAFGSAIGYRYFGSLYLGLVAGVAAGVLCGIVLSLLYVRLGTDQIVTGILFNVFALGLTTTLYQRYLGGTPSKAFGNLGIPGLRDIPWIGTILFNQNFLVYAAIIAAPCVFYLMRRTWFGLCSRAAAENPRVVETAGLDVRYLRYLAMIIGCALTAVGGATIVLATSGGFVSGLTSGRGYIALAVVVLSRWNPFGVIVGSMLFGVAQAIQFQVQHLGLLSTVPSDFVLMLPYIITIIVIFFALGSRYPAACGIPYWPSAKSVSPVSIALSSSPDDSTSSRLSG